MASAAVKPPGMQDFYCDDFYWAISVDGGARGLFVLERDAMFYYADICEKRPDEDVALWRLNGGWLCTPAVASRPGTE